MSHAQTITGPATTTYTLTAPSPSPDTDAFRCYCTLAAASKGGGMASLAGIGSVLPFGSLYGALPGTGSPAPLTVILAPLTALLLCGISPSPRACFVACKVG